MPIYEYRCAACGERFETLMPRHDAPSPHCTQCGSAIVERQPSAFAVTQPGPPVTSGPCGSSDCACRRAG